MLRVPSDRGRGREGGNGASKVVQQQRGRTYGAFRVEKVRVKSNKE